MLTVALLLRPCRPAHYTIFPTADDRHFNWEGQIPVTREAGTWAEAATLAGRHAAENGWRDFAISTYHRLEDFGFPCYGGRPAESIFLVICREIAERCAGDGPADQAGFIRWARSRVAHALKLLNH